MKAAIVLMSVHHSNTKKIADKIAEILPADIFDLSADNKPDISGYDTVGFASGIYYGKFHPAVVNFAENLDFTGIKNVFFIYTCGAPIMNYAKHMMKITERSGAECLGVFRCLGFDTFGPLKLIGGLGKGRPGAKDLEKAAAFAEKIASRV